MRAKIAVHGSCTGCYCGAIKLPTSSLQNFSSGQTNGTQHFKETGQTKETSKNGYKLLPSFMSNNDKRNKN